MSPSLRQRRRTNQREQWGLSCVPQELRELSHGTSFAWRIWKAFFFLAVC